MFFRKWTVKISNTTTMESPKKKIDGNVNFEAQTESKSSQKSKLNFYNQIPGQLQKLIATTDSVVLLFLLQVSSSDEPHLL